MDMEENNRTNEQDDPKPLTDEEYVEWKKKEDRKFGIIATIVDFIVDFSGNAEIQPPPA